MYFTGGMVFIVGGDSNCNFSKTHEVVCGSIEDGRVSFIAEVNGKYFSYSFPEAMCVIATQIDKEQADKSVQTIKQALGL